MRKSPNAIITPLDYVFEDKLGRSIRFEMIDDSELPNRGFRVDQLAAYADEEKVGYLKASYICGSTFKNFFPSGVFNYIHQHGGASLFSVKEGYEEPGTDLKKADVEKLNAVAKVLDAYRYSPRLPSEPLADYSEFVKWFKSEEPTGKYLKKLAEFEDFKGRIDLPFVDYINTGASPFNDLHSDNRRLGIGSMLYKIMAKELDKRGMRLHSSSLQQPEAVAAWKKLAEEGICYKSRKMKGRLAINPNKFDLELKPQGLHL